MAWATLGPSMAPKASRWFCLGMWSEDLQASADALFRHHLAPRGRGIDVAVPALLVAQLRDVDLQRVDRERRQLDLRAAQLRFGDREAAEQMLEEAKAELERIEQGESTADRWVVEQRIIHAQTQLEVATGASDIREARVKVGPGA